MKIDKIKLIGLLTILLAAWILLYLIPEIFVSLFNTLLGNLVLIVTTILVYTKNKYFGIGLGIAFLVLFRFAQLSRTSSHSKEGFTQKSINDFLLIQDTINKHKVFDMNIISQQASQAELDYFNTNGLWPWSIPTIELYQEAIRKNPYIRADAADATNYARTIYNEAAILRVLSYQTKEGQFLIDGVLVKDPQGNQTEELPSGFGSFPYESGLQADRTYDVIKCNLNNESKPALERIKYTGHDGIYGQQTKQTTPVDYNELENIIPGFKFENNPCNPCGLLADIPDYSCRFKLQVKK